MSETVIDMVKCPSCQKEYIQGDLDLVCKECAPGLQMDITLNSIIIGVLDLEGTDEALLSKRAKIINDLVNRLKKINKKLKGSAPETP